MKCEGPPPATPAGYFLEARDLDTSPLESLAVFFTAQGQPLLKDQDWHAYDAHHTLQARLPAPPSPARLAPPHQVASCCTTKCESSVTARRCLRKCE
mmetsp:Transcript_26010/g.47448  ORF Transcript_26010/g.47448 Transcript_26010/m.47448 type:complete len:97 (+) Transcript_26010:310-600(+)